MKRKYYLLIGVAILLLSYFLYVPVGAEVEAIYQKNYLHVLIFPVVSLILNYKYNFLNKYKKVLIFVFIISCSLGLGIIIKTFVTNSSISYLGLMTVFMSFAFLALSLNINPLTRPRL